MHVLQGVLTTDIMSHEKRSQLMGRIKSRNTRIEKIITGGLRRKGITNFKREGKLIGKPDLIFSRSRLVVFLDGDFWHGYKFDTWKEKLSPFWYNKILGNIKRDRSVRKQLRREGWLVIRLWEHEIEKNQEKCIQKIVNVVKANESS